MTKISKHWCLKAVHMQVYSDICWTLEFKCFPIRGFFFLCKCEERQNEILMWEKDQFQYVWQRTNEQQYLVTCCCYPVSLTDLLYRADRCVFIISRYLFDLIFKQVFPLRCRICILKENKSTELKVTFADYIKWQTNFWV